MKKVITLILILIISFSHLNIFEVLSHYIIEKKPAFFKELNTDENEKDESEKKLEVFICENDITPHVNFISSNSSKFNITVDLIFPPCLDIDHQPPKLNSTFI